MEELLEVKIAVANSVLYLAILNASDDDIRQLRQLGLEFKRIMNEAPADIEKMYQASKRFNEYLSEICTTGNRWALIGNSFRTFRCKPHYSINFYYSSLFIIY